MVNWFTDCWSKIKKYLHFLVWKNVFDLSTDLLNDWLSSLWLTWLIDWLIDWLYSREQQASLAKEDLSDMVAEHAAKQKNKRKRQEQKDDKEKSKKYKEFKF